MRVALLYPPPWKIPTDGAAPDPIDGPPEGYRPGDLDADFYQTPYGLFALGAAALDAGHQVKVLNLSSYAWDRVDEILRTLDADVWGISCWTANRRGVRLAARAIKAHHPGAHVVIGGPHVTPLAERLVAKWPEVDVACVGESDVTFLELIDRVQKGEPLRGVAGSVYRDEDGDVARGPERSNVKELDALPSPQRFFDTHIMMTSRGCPWACTFCGAESSWGRGFRANSVDYVLDAMERVLARLPVKMLQIKDDTFTTHKKRVVELCRRIRERKLSFFWSCDTRVDLLTDELLREMRLAGCQRLSLGVETGSQKILDAIDKKITPDEILASTELAKRYGIKVRYYMMLGNRGETRETFEETLRFLERARPHEYVFSCLSIYPGTRDYDDAVAAGWLAPDAFFEGDFQELKTPFDADEALTSWLNEWFVAHTGLQTMHKPSSQEYRAVLERLGDHHAAHMDLGSALYAEGELDAAEKHVRRAMELGYPLPGLAENHLACIAKARGDIDGMMDHFSEAARIDPQHWVLIKNVNAARAWFKQGGPGRGLPLELEVRQDFQLLERTVQPTLPGPLPEGFDKWDDAPHPEASLEHAKLPEVEGSTKGLADRKRLRVIDG